MDDSEDDARYPPNPRRSLPSSSHRPKLPFRNPPFPPLIDGGDGNDDPNDLNRPMDDSDSESDDDGGRRDRRIRADDGGSSSESRGKRRRLDKLALGFEFAPRAAPAARPQRPPPARNSLGDWSEESTFVLLDAWGEVYVQNGRKSLRSDEWSEVAKKVCHSSRTVRSDAQCRNRIDTLKKKYKKEKASFGETASSNSRWVYFKKMDFLMSPSPPPPPQQRRRRPQPARPNFYLNRSNGLDEIMASTGDTGSDGDEEEEEEEDGDSEGLPPKMAKGFGVPGSASFRMLADSITRFGEIYERMENNKRQQLAELEQMRKEFQRDLEVQTRQILERAHQELAKLRETEEEDEEEEEDDDNEHEDIDVPAR